MLFKEHFKSRFEISGFNQKTKSRYKEVNYI